MTADTKQQREVSIADVIAILVRRRRIFMACVVLSVGVGVIYAVFATPTYVASVTARVLTQGDAGGLSGLADRLGGAAALVGIDLTSGRSDRGEYLAILNSRELGEKFILAHGLMQQLFADAWDTERQAWRPDNPSWSARARRTLSGWLAAISGDRGWRKPGGEPTLWQAYKQFEQIRTVTETGEDGLVRISFQFRDPVLAAEWASAFVAMANDQIRDNAIQEATRALAYLDDEVEKTTVVDLRSTIFGLVKTQLENIMLANARQEYAFRVIDQAVVPEERARPRRTLIVASALLLGVFLGSFFALSWEILIHARRTHERR